MKRTAHLRKKNLASPKPTRSLSRTNKRKRPVNQAKSSSAKKKISIKQATLSLLALSLLLVIVASYILWQIVPGFLIRTDDATYVIYSSSLDQQPPTLWLIVTRGMYRPTQVFQLTVEPSDLLVSGLVPELPLGAILPTLLTQEGSSAELLLSQSLGILVDHAEMTTVPLVDQTELSTLIISEAWDAIGANEWKSPWIQLAIGLKMADEPKKTSLTDIVGYLDRIDLALMGEFSTCPVAVLNTTTRNGLALRYATLLEQSGGQVIRTDGAATYDSIAPTLPTSDDDNQKTRLFVSTNVGEDCAVANSRLREHFPNAELIVDDVLPERFRSKLVVVLGSNVLESGVFSSLDDT